MLSALVNKPNQVLERQKYIQASTKPLHYRMPRSTLYVRAYYAGVTLGVVGVGYSIVSLIKGKPSGE